MTIDQMLEKIRSLISKCDASERETYEALMSEADGWQMRLDEIELSDDEDEGE